MENGFQITCLNCGSTYCEIVSEDHYETNYDEEYEYWGTTAFVKCNVCYRDSKF